MAPPAAGETAAAGGDAQPQQQRQAGGGFGQTITGIIRIAVFCYFASKFFSPKQKPVDPSKPPPHLMSNLFQKGEPLVIGSLQVDCFLYFARLRSKVFVFDNRICGFIYRRIINSMTLGMMVRLFGTRPTYLTLCGSQRALEPCQ